MLQKNPPGVTFDLFKSRTELRGPFVGLRDLPGLERDVAVEHLAHRDVEDGVVDQISVRLP